MPEVAIEVPVEVNRPGLNPRNIERTPVFDHIPSLRELFPKTGGLAGVSYSQVCTDNFLAIQEAGWDEVADTMLYVIKGPRGIASCKIFAWGKPIRGVAIGTSKQLCTVDKDIREKTGFLVGQYPGQQNADVPKADLVVPAKTVVEEDLVDVETSPTDRVEKEEPSSKEASPAPTRGTQTRRTRRPEAKSE